MLCLLMLNDLSIILFETDSVGLLSYAWFKQLLSGTFVIIHDIGPDHLQALSHLNLLIFEYYKFLKFWNILRFLPLYYCDYKLDNCTDMIRHILQSAPCYLNIILYYYVWHLSLKMRFKCPNHLSYQVIRIAIYCSCNFFRISFNHKNAIDFFFITY